MSHETSSKQRTTETRSETPAATGFAFLDMMLQVQKASQQALSSFIPLASATAQAAGQAVSTRLDERAGAGVQRTSGGVEVIPVGEESLHVGTRTVQGETTRLRRVVVETPVEQQVKLRTETVVVERRKPASTLVANSDVLSERVVEMTDSFQVAETWKSVHLREEVVLRTEVVEHTETVRDTVRRDEVQVEQAAAAAPRARIETQVVAPKRDEQVQAEEAVAKQIERNIEAARLVAEVRKQDAVPPAAVKAEADRPSPAPAPVPTPARPAPEATAQASQHAAPQSGRPAPATTAASDSKPGASPRDALADKTPASAGRRA